MKKSLLLISIPTLILTIFLIGLISYWLYPRTVVTYSSVVTDKLEYRAGDRISYTLSYCKNYDIEGTVNRVLVNSIKIYFSSYDTVLSCGCGTKTYKDLVIPEFMDEGVYHLEASAVYKVNPLQTFIGRWKTNEFKIIK